MSSSVAELWKVAHALMVSDGATPVEKKIKVGVLGTANIARKNVAAMNASVGVEAYAIASRSQEKADAFAKEFGMKKAYRGYEAVLEDPDVAAVYIPLPTSMHKEWVEKAATAGKHILCEKPCFSTAEEVLEAVEFCQSKGVVYMDGVMFMHHIRYASMLKSCWGPSAFLPNAVTTNFCFGATPDFFKKNIRADPKLDGLGALGDLGYYNIRLALGAFAYEVPKYASAQIIVDHNTVPLDLDCLLSWEKKEDKNGLPFIRTSNFRSSFFQLSHQDALISSTETSVAMVDFVVPMTAKESTLNWTNKVTWIQDANGGREINRDAEEQRFGYCRQELNMWEDFAILTSKPPSAASRFWPAVSLLTHVCIDAILRSAKAGGTKVEVDPEGLMSKYLAQQIKYLFKHLEHCYTDLPPTVLQSNSFDSDCTIFSTHRRSS